MFDKTLRRGVACDGVEMTACMKGRFRVGPSTWYVTSVEAVWREWSLGGGGASGRCETGSDLEVWRVHAVPAGGGEDVIAVLTCDLVTGRWRVGAVWD